MDEFDLLISTSRDNPINPLETGNTLLCSHIFNHVLNISICVVTRGNISPRLSGNSEANASEFLDSLKEMFHIYYTTSTHLFQYWPIMFN